MPRSLADGHVKLVLLAAKPANLKSVTLAELTAGKDISSRVLASDFKLGPTGSDTLSEPSLCETAASEVFTTGKFEGNITVFRYFNAEGKAETGIAGELGDAAYQALKVKGTEAWIVKRFTSKLATEAFAAGDEIGVYHVESDNPQDGDATGYIKATFPLAVKGDSEIDSVVAAAA